MESNASGTWQYPTNSIGDWPQTGPSGPLTWTYPTSTYYTAPRFAIIHVGSDLFKLDTITGETWQKEVYSMTWKVVSHG